ncbi:DUF5677 domain-containing protein [Chryseobacterium arthrosphaerae]|uniref:DUF5677 domain-containing protein n=1 Tax=Chryseobacterium arthrosphaerae TaxID=651561 RepID=UPI0028AA853F|nr:DUF5677 domain-containing protein [Chryseobacterium arthrosphaerae]
MWEKDKNIIFEKHIELINKNIILLYGTIKDHLDTIKPILPLVDFILTRIGTITELIRKEQLWDGEIILRSALETLVKMVFITSSSGKERAERIDEYWNCLAEINSLKMSEQAKKSLQYFGESELHRVAYSPLLLQEDEENQLREKWPKKKRQIMEQKWSFSSMITSISNLYKGEPLEMISALSHSYRMSSHVMHGDETGIMIIQERESRDTQEREKANNGHFIRLISDCVTYTSFVASEAMNFLGLNDERIYFLKSIKELDGIKELTSKYQSQVFNDSDYDKYKNFI